MQVALFPITTCDQCQCCRLLRRQARRLSLSPRAIAESALQVDRFDRYQADSPLANLPSSFAQYQRRGASLYDGDSFGYRALRHAPLELYGKPQPSTSSTSAIANILRVLWQRISLRRLIPGWLILHLQAKVTFQLPCSSSCLPLHGGLAEWSRRSGRAGSRHMTCR